MRPRHLYKYFSKMEYAESFCEGHLLFRSLAYFRDYEDNNVREGEREGASVYRPNDGLSPRLPPRTRPARRGRRPGTSHHGIEK